MRQKNFEENPSSELAKFSPVLAYTQIKTITWDFSKYAGDDTRWEKR